MKQSKEMLLRLPQPAKQAKIEEFVDVGNSRPLLRYFKALYKHFVYANNFGLALDDDDRAGKQGKPVLLSKLFVPPLMAERRIDPEELVAAENKADKEIPSRFAFHTILQGNQRIFILGDPGSGKSTLINWLNLELSFSGDNLCKSVLGPLVPINFILRDIKGLSAVSSWDDLWQSWKTSNPVFGQIIEEDSATLDRMLAAGQIMFLFDGLDEISGSATRSRLCRAIVEAMDRFSCCRFVITSRILGFSQEEFFQGKTARIANADADDVTSSRQITIEEAEISFKTPGDGVFPFEQDSNMPQWYIAPFDLAQVRSFCRNWYSQYVAWPAGEKSRAWNLVESLELNAGLTRLARIPVLLNIICFIHARRNRLPDGRAELYRRIAETYLTSLDQARGIRFRDRKIMIDFSDLYRLLGQIAWQIQNNREEEKGSILINRKDVVQVFCKGLEELGFAAEDAQEETDFILAYIAQRSGLFVPRGEDEQGDEVYAFTHLSFMEFFVAVELRSQVEFWPPGGQEWQRLRRKTQMPVWKEPLTLFFELMENGAQIENYLERLIGKPVREIQDIDNLEPDENFLPVPRELPPWREKHSGALGRNFLWPGFTSWGLVAAIVMDSAIRLRPPLRQQYIQVLWSLVLSDSIQQKPHYETAGLGQILDHLWTTAFDSQAKFVRQAKTRKTLVLHGKGISDVDVLKKLPNLRALDLSSTSVNDLSPLVSLTNLEDLSLISTSVSDLSALASLTNLERLDLSATSVSDLSALASLKNLERLYLSNTSVSDLSALASLKNLKLLSLMSTPVSDLSALASLTNLERLYLSATSVSDVSALASLTNLERLYLSSTSVSDLSALASLKNLEILDLRVTSASDLSALASLTNLESFYLSSTSVSDISALASLTKLRWLDLKDSAVIDTTVLDHVTNLKIFT